MNYGPPLRDRIRWYGWRGVMKREWSSTVTYLKTERRTVVLIAGTYALSWVVYEVARAVAGH